jgi:acetoin utilization deacetylase AcuC-like enzyme
MKAFYSDHFVLPLPAGHRFPMSKYSRLRDRVARELPAVELIEAAAAGDDELALAHGPDYIERVASGRITDAEMRAIGFPWSTAMVERSRRSTGATIAACRAALLEGVAANLAGGTHHAFANSGHGYCVFNDVAVATRLLQSEAAGAQRRLRVAVIDLDVHQGDGTASIFAGDDSVFTLSLHAEKNFPFRKQASALDLGLPDAATDDEYLSALQAALATLRARFAPQLIVYLAGADAHEGDRLGRLKLTTAGMAARDQCVFDLAAQLDLPVAVVMGGGYGREIEITVTVHYNTIRTALQAWHERRRVLCPTELTASASIFAGERSG